MMKENHSETFKVYRTAVSTADFNTLKAAFREKNQFQTSSESFMVELGGNDANLEIIKANFGAAFLDKMEYNHIAMVEFESNGR